MRWKESWHKLTGDQLSAVLFPIGTEEFLGHFRGRSHLYVGGRPAEFYDAVIRLQDIDQYLADGEIPSLEVNVIRNGIEIPHVEWNFTRHGPRGCSSVVNPERLLALYREGCTLVLNSVNETIPSLQSVCRCLSSELGVSTQANIYITPAGGKGFPKHTDTHDVLVLQISGRKCWRIHPKPAGQNEEVPLDLELRAGDLLFIPRGMGHEAYCSEEASIHTTVGLHAVYWFQLVEELAAAARENAFFQEPVPLQLEADSVQREFNRQFPLRVSSLLAELSASGWKDRHRHTQDARQPRGWSGRLVDILGLDRIDMETVVVSRPDMPARVEQRQNALEVLFRGGSISVPTFLSNTVSRLLEPTPIAVSDLPGMLTNQGKVDFVRNFVASGVLTVVKFRSTTKD